MHKNAQQRLRRTKRPSKQLLFLLVDEFLTEGRRYDTALDLACGSMYFAGVLPAGNYVGVDLDEERLREGTLRHPGAMAICSKIEELSEDISGDIVLCLQCIGFNKHFDNRQTLRVVERIIAATQPNGDLIFNTGPRAAEFANEVDSRVVQSFETLRVFDYGSFGQALFDGRISRAASVLLARLMRAFPSIARSSASGRRLYICQNKRT